jgi:hypothetical protein
VSSGKLQKKVVFVVISDFGSLEIGPESTAGREDMPVWADDSSFILGSKHKSGIYEREPAHNLGADSQTEGGQLLDRLASERKHAPRDGVRHAHVIRKREKQ